MPTETKPAAAPAVAAPAPTGDKPLLTQPVALDQLSDAQHAKWLKTGELPVAGAKQVKSLVRADADGNPPAEPVDGEVQLGDEPVEPKPAATPAKKVGVGSATYAQLKARVREAEAELARLRSGPRNDEPTEPVADEPTAPAPKAAAAPRPKSTDLDAQGKAKYETWEQYEDALLEWREAQVLAKVDQRVSEREQQRQIAQANAVIERDWNAKVDEAQAKYDDFATVALDKKTGPYELIRPGSAVDQWILKRPLGAEILYYFGKNRAELLRIGQMHPVDASAELVALEAKLNGSTPAPAMPPESQVTRAPKPAAKVGGRGTSAIDDSTRALMDDPTRNPDAMRRFMEAENRREIRERLGTR
jgi:hypothetical protein